MLSENEKGLDCQPLLDTFTEKTEFEDLVLYKEYLSKFDVEHDLEDLELNYKPNLEQYKADFPFFLIFIAASPSNTYELDYDVDTNKAVVTVHVQDTNMTVTRRLDELEAYQFIQLFQLYLEEQLNLASSREESEYKKNNIDEKREVLLLVYQKKVKRLKQQRERILKNQKESDDIMSSLNNLLKS